MSPISCNPFARSYPNTENHNRQNVGTGTEGAANMAANKLNSTAIQCHVTTISQDSGYTSNGVVHRATDTSYPSPQNCAIQAVSSLYETPIKRLTCIREVAKALLPTDSALAALEEYDLEPVAKDDDYDQQERTSTLSYLVECEGLTKQEWRRLWDLDLMLGSARCPNNLEYTRNNSPSCQRLTEDQAANLCYRPSASYDAVYEGTHDYVYHFVHHLGFGSWIIQNKNDLGLVRAPATQRWKEKTDRIVNWSYAVSKETSIYEEKVPLDKIRRGICADYDYGRVVSSVAHSTSPSDARRQAGMSTWTEANDDMESQNLSEINAEARTGNTDQEEDCLHTPSTVSSIANTTDDAEYESSPGDSGLDFGDDVGLNYLDRVRVPTAIQELSPEEQARRSVNVENIYANDKEEELRSQVALPEIHDPMPDDREILYSWSDPVDDEDRENVDLLIEQSEDYDADHESDDTESVLSDSENAEPLSGDTQPSSISRRSVFEVLREIYQALTPPTSLEPDSDVEDEESEDAAEISPERMVKRTRRLSMKIDWKEKKPGYFYH